MSCLARYVKIQWDVPVINLLPLIQIHPFLTCFGTLEQDPVNISPLPAVSVNNRGHLEGCCPRMGLLSLLLGCFLFLLQCGCKWHERGRTERTLQWVCPANFSAALQVSCGRALSNRIWTSTLYGGYPLPKSLFPPWTFLPLTLEMVAASCIFYSCVL